MGCNLKLNVATTEENANKQRQESEKNTKSEKNLNAKEEKKSITNAISTEKPLENETIKVKDVNKVKEPTEDKIVEKHSKENNSEKSVNPEVSSKSSIEENNLKESKTTKAKSDSVENKEDTKT